ncbi:MAG: LysR family transcriptional regulator [Bacilli bacterium]|jgi:DNA-binding transcriptional LysR family regulator|nr:LysR family transcriptional regulator [Bacilli bacterium]
MISNTYLVFIRAAENESFNTAAKLLNLTPSAISHAISKLEYELGITLFIRNKKGVSLTIEGQELLAYAQKIVEQEELLFQKASLIKGPINGIVRIGTFSSVCKCWLPDIIATFIKEYPLSKITVKQGGYADVMRWIENGEVDLGFLPKTLCENFSYQFLYKDELLCVLPKSFKSKNEEYVEIDELSDMVLIQQPNENSLESKFIQTKQVNNFGSSFMIEDDLSMIAVVDSGIGFCISPAMAIIGNERDVLKKSFYPQEYRDICLAWNTNKIVLPLTKKMQECIINYARKI